MVIDCASSALATVPLACAQAGAGHNQVNAATPPQRFRNTKARLRLDGGVANPRNAKEHCCGFRLDLGPNPSLLSCSETSVPGHWYLVAQVLQPSLAAFESLGIAERGLANPRRGNRHG